VILVVGDPDHLVDVGVVELAGGAGLAIGPRREPLAAAEHLHGPRFARRRVVPGVHGAEAAAAEHVGETVPAGHDATFELPRVGCGCGLGHGPQLAGTAWIPANPRPQGMVGSVRAS